MGGIMRIKNSFKKYLFLKLLTAVLVGCASQPKQNSSESGAPADLSPTPIPAPSAVHASPVAPPVTTQASSHSDVTPLERAIRSNSDEQIFRAATDILLKNPNDLQALNALGLYHYRKSQHSAAQIFLNRALKVNPNSSDTHNNLGLVFLAQGEDDRALALFKQALRINSNDANAGANAGAIYLQNKDYIKAEIALRPAVRKYNRDVRILTNYAISQVGLKKYSQAEEKYKEVLKIQDSFQPAMLGLAILYVDHLNKPAEGLELINRIKFLGPSSESRSRINLLENKAKTGVK
jgi:Flp pilus assembly protein TadD